MDFERKRSNFSDSLLGSAVAALSIESMFAEYASIELRNVSGFARIHSSQHYREQIEIVEITSQKCRQVICEGVQRAEAAR